eukprot:Blabericola_migrator_1__671@NODE_1167_length_5225_cov_306_574060_g92_i2_p3_GENE_NODE_1167_length_5225_cov_306_574060_g92_i2NODE_1167_length_5225_cov_306_574060_g92_i2_p3_ORF_typecomplete_len343_score37_78_NODE_1167_length_5225_cov_306_574060_g92_i239254953
MITIIFPIILPFLTAYDIIKLTVLDRFLIPSLYTKSRQLDAMVEYVCAAFIGLKSTLRDPPLCDSPSPYTDFREAVNKLPWTVLCGRIRSAHHRRLTSCCHSKTEHSWIPWEFSLIVQRNVKCFLHETVETPPDHIYPSYFETRQDLGMTWERSPFKTNIKRLMRLGSHFSDEEVGWAALVRHICICAVPWYSVCDMLVERAVLTDPKWQEEFLKDAMRLVSWKEGWDTWVDVPNKDDYAPRLHIPDHWTFADFYSRGWSLRKECVTHRHTEFQRWINWRKAVRRWITTHAICQLKNTAQNQGFKPTPDGVWLCVSGGRTDRSPVCVSLIGETTFCCQFYMI